MIDLLAALNLSRQTSGVSTLADPDDVVYRVRPRAPHLSLPLEYSQLLRAALQGAIGLHLTAQQALSSDATLLSLSSSTSAILRVTSSTLRNTLHVDYPAGGGGRGHASFPGTNPFSSGEWVQLAVSLEPHRLLFFVDCQEAVVVPIKREEKINLELPRDLLITLASTPGKKESRFNVGLSLIHSSVSPSAPAFEGSLLSLWFFVLSWAQGHLKAAVISLKPYLRRPWRCDNITGEENDLDQSGSDN